MGPDITRLYNASRATPSCTNLAISGLDLAPAAPEFWIDRVRGSFGLTAARAALMNGGTRLRSIEPFPMEKLKQGIPGVECLDH